MLSAQWTAMRRREGKTAIFRSRRSPPEGEGERDSSLLLEALASTLTLHQRARRSDGAQGRGAGRKGRTGGERGWVSECTAGV